MRAIKGRTTSGASVWPTKMFAVAESDSDREMDALKAIQAARYIDGTDITRVDALVAILQSLGLVQAAARLSAADSELMAANSARQAQGIALRLFAPHADMRIVDGVPAQGQRLVPARR